MIKKGMKVLAVAILLFVGTTTVKAFQGPYSYDINKFYLQGNYVYIEGWAAINNGSNAQTHNINPGYTMTLLGKNDAGSLITSKSYANQNTGTRKDFTAANSNPKDYTKAYFDEYDGNSYPETKDGSRGSLVVNAPDGEYFYINIDFVFKIPLADFTNMFYNRSVKRIYFDLTVDVPYMHTKVFGAGPITQSSVSKTIHIGIQQDRVASDSGLLSTLTFHNTLTSLTNIVRDGYVQGNPNAFLSNNYVLVQCSNGSILRSSSCTSAGYSKTYLFYYDGSDDSSKNFHIYGKKSLSDLGGAGGEEYYYYTIRIKQNGSGSTRAVDGGSGGTNAYLPAFWSKPLDNSPLFVTPTCDPNVEECPPCDPSREICSEDDPCSKVDPEAQYCCYHNTDPICKPCTGSKCFPDKDTPQTKTGTCKTSGTSTVSFKYPAEGWGKTLLTNTACSVSCQEQLTATFQPSRSVRAGMGFDYPVNIQSSRYCTADYDNFGWKAKVDAAATSANTAYNNMVTSLNNAKSLDNACGTKQTLTSVPSCACGTRSGNTCRGCTCSRSVFDHTESYSCGTAKAPRTCHRSVYRTEYYSCTKSASCPSGYSYRSSLDRCAKDVCSRNNSKTWSSAQAEISSQISSASSYRGNYNSYVATVNSLKGDRSTCDNYVANNKYNGATNTKISTNSVPNQTSYTITSSSTSEDKGYESSRQSEWRTFAIYQCNNRSYTAPSLVGDYRSSASAFTGTYCNHQTANQSYADFWNKKSDSNITLEFSTAYYVQRYTGELLPYAASGYDYHGHYAYTDFYAKSASNNFSVTATTLGPNLPTVSNSLWSINPYNCQYNVTNMIFPPAGDPQNTKYGNVAFMYRQISLTDPFPNRTPGENWNGKTNLITSNGYKVYGNTPLYAITLNPNTMQTIRGYGTNYGSFYTNDPYRSQLVETYIQNGIIVKGK